MLKGEYEHPPGYFRVNHTMETEQPRCRIRFAGTTIECQYGENLRKALIDGGVSPYTPEARFINCRGLGTCGTCAVRVVGPMSEKTKIEAWRLNFPPHQEVDGLRLACQVRVFGDLVVEKGSGLWGHL